MSKNEKENNDIKQEAHNVMPDQSKEQKQTEKQMDLNDLKAKLGLKLSLKQEEVSTNDIKQEKIKDMSFTFDDALEGADFSESELDKMESSAAEIKKKAIFTKNILIIAAISILFLLVGLFFGRVLRDRRFANMRKTEAEVLSANIAGAKNEISREELQKLINNHVVNIKEIYAKIQDMKRDPERAKMIIDELRIFLEVCSQYRDKKVYYSTTQVFPSYVINGELIGDIIEYIDAVKNLYDRTALLASYNDMLNELSGPEEKGEVKQLIYVEPFEHDGAEWLKSVYYISDIKKDAIKPKQKAKGFEVAVLPLGKTQGELVDTTSVVELDIGPIAKSKAARYKSSIMKSVEKNLEDLKKAADSVAALGLGSKLKKESEKASYWFAF